MRFSTPVSSRCLSGLGEAPTAQSSSGSLDGAGLTQRSVKGAVGEVVQSSEANVSKRRARGSPVPRPHAGTLL